MDVRNPSRKGYSLQSCNGHSLEFSWGMEESLCRTESYVNMIFASKKRRASTKLCSCRGEEGETRS